MALTTATITFDISDQLGNDFDPRRTKVWVTTNTDTVIDTAGDKIRLGSGNATLNADGTGSIVVWVPGTGSNPASWQTTVHVDYPDRNATGGRRTKSFGPFTITTSANLADLVAEMPVQPEYASAFLNRYKTNDHGNVSGTLTIDPAYGYHVFDATGPTLVTVLPGDDVAFKAISGADDVTVDDAPDLVLTDGGWITGVYYRGAWDFSAGGSGEPAIPDTTPPAAVTNLAATPGDDGTTATVTFTPATDSESTAKHRLRYYVTGQTPPAFPTSGPLYNVTTSPVALTGLTIGTAYTVEIQSYSAGGTQATTDTATFTTPAPAGWNAWDSIDFADQTAGTYSSPKDFTTDTGKTLRATSETTNGIIVGSGKVKGVFQQPGISLGYPSAVSPAANRITIPYELVGTNPSYGPGITVDLTMATGGVRLTLEFDYNAYDDRRMKIQPTAGSGYTQALGTGAAGAGYTKNAEWVNGVPNAGTLVIVPEGQVLKAYINDVHVYTADFTNHMDGGSPNPLVGKFTGLAMSNNAAIYAMTLETYTS